jgi:hypothetical protein
MIDQIELKHPAGFEAKLVLSKLKVHLATRTFQTSQGSQIPRMKNPWASAGGDEEL